MRRYSEQTVLADMTVLDPFAGSGTIAVEAVKLGARAIAFDINPVATLVQRQALQTWDTEALSTGYKLVEASCRDEIDRVHRAEDGRTVLYYFWVAVAECPDCGCAVRLFDSPIFSKHAYPKRIPSAQIVCPDCLDIQESTHDFTEAICRNGHTISPNGAVRRAEMTCRRGHVSKIVAALRGRRPDYEMYAKLVVSETGRKTYEPITTWDRELYRDCETRLSTSSDLVLPAGILAPGNNTDQARRWGFVEWRDFFNARQLYSLALLARAVRDLDTEPETREALCALFSGTLEFNNMFCSFKGEGTGAVRHMFSHHVLKPERTPLEAHPWGTPHSSGSFSTLMKSRLIRAHDYKRMPTDLVPMRGGVERVSGISRPLETALATSFEEFHRNADIKAYVTTKNSAFTDIPDGYVDLVITDPPYMDNVHYAELADFFHAWLKMISPYDGYPKSDSTRSEGEVQHADAAEFGHAIRQVWTECGRVLRADGLLAFTFHHARVHGWVELVSALHAAGLRITSVQPIKGEMTTSVTKAAAMEPSNLDSVVVCRRRAGEPEIFDPETLVRAASSRLSALVDQGVAVGAGDIRSVIRGTALSAFAEHTDDLSTVIPQVEGYADEVIRIVLGERGRTTSSVRSSTA
ncbi:DNA methyltransferase [Nocardia arizonensis]|uniref:DNA methyltransferase n=1 Tax=Nocardia arizonensis TaxID=1141647 RepID=UPI001951D654|nr:DNA methyltransferase [Nocardia arizonensis]